MVLFITSDYSSTRVSVEKNCTLPEISVPKYTSMRGLVLLCINRVIFVIINGY